MNDVKAIEALEKAIKELEEARLERETYDSFPSSKRLRDAVTDVGIEFTKLKRELSK